MPWILSRLAALAVFLCFATGTRAAEVSIAILEVDTSPVVNALRIEQEAAARKTLEAAGVVPTRIGPGGPRKTEIALPPGTDVDALHRALVAVLGASGTRLASNVQSSSEGRIVLELPPSTITRAEAEAVETAARILRERFEIGSFASTSVRTLPGGQIEVTVYGYWPYDAFDALATKPGSLAFHEVLRPVVGAEATGPGEIVLPEADGAGFLVMKETPFLTGRSVADAELSFRYDDGRPGVDIRLDSDGARRFGAFTSGNIGSMLAIVVDGAVVSAPVIQTEILGGSLRIDGNFSADEAANIAAKLATEPISTPIELVDVRIEERSSLFDANDALIQMGSAIGAVLILLVLF